MLRWLKRVLTRNLLLKLTALVCAVVVWVYVDSFVPVERTLAPSPFWPFTVPLPDNLTARPAPGVRVTTLPAQGIRVTVFGPSRQVRLLRSEDIHWDAPTGRRAGEKMVFDLRKEDFGIRRGGGIVIREVKPSHIEIDTSHLELQP